MSVCNHYTSRTVTTDYRTRLHVSRFYIVCNLPFLNFVITVNDDSGINEMFLSLTTRGKNAETPKELEIYGYLIYLIICISNL